MAVRGKIDGTLFLVISVAGANSTSGFSLLSCCPVPGGRGVASSLHTQRHRPFAHSIFNQDLRLIQTVAGTQGPGSHSF
eukprot:scaffold17728_cov119-Skeletonema_dohrnii-CCMP3373.AAC.3